MLTSRSVLLRGFAAVFVLLLSACGGGGGEIPASNGPPAIGQFSAARNSYFIGERAQLIARFDKGTARVEPGGIAVQNGQAVMSRALVYGPNEFELIVSDGTGTVSRRLTLNSTYRDRMRSVDAPFARAEHAAVRLADGRVLIIGGEDDSFALPTSLWLFDPATEQFNDFGASLSTGRFGFTAVTLNNGDVVMAGGDRGLGAVPARAGPMPGRLGAARRRRCGQR